MTASRRMRTLSLMRVAPKTSQAERIVRRFGGPCRMARMMGKSKSTVYRWVDSGTILMGNWVEILIAAKKNNINVTLRDFYIDVEEEFEKWMKAEDAKAKECAKEVVSEKELEGAA